MIRLTTVSIATRGHCAAPQAIPTMVASHRWAAGRQIVELALAEDDQTGPDYPDERSGCLKQSQGVHPRTVELMVQGHDRHDHGRCRDTDQAMRSHASGMAAPFAIETQQQTENRSHAKPADDIPIEPFEGCDRVEFHGSLFRFLPGSRDGAFALAAS